MASKKNTRKAPARVANTRTTTRTKAAPARVANRTATEEEVAETRTARNRTAAARRVQAKPVTRDNAKFGTLQEEQVGAIVAGQEVTRQIIEDSPVRNRESEVQKAVSQRESDVKSMQKDFDGRERTEVVRRKEMRTSMAPAMRVPVEPGSRTVPTGIDADVTSPVAVGVGALPDHMPGTGVADPKDLAPGQSLEPSPPGGVAIAPLPNKPGTLYSKL